MSYWTPETTAIHLGMTVLMNCLGLITRSIHGAVSQALEITDQVNSLGEPKRTCSTTYSDNKQTEWSPVSVNQIPRGSNGQVI